MNINIYFQYTYAKHTLEIWVWLIFITNYNIKCDVHVFYNDQTLQTLRITFAVLVRCWNNFNRPFWDLGGRTHKKMDLLVVMLPGNNYDDKSYSITYRGWKGRQVLQHGISLCLRNHLFSGLCVFFGTRGRCFASCVSNMYTSQYQAKTNINSSVQR